MSKSKVGFVGGGQMALALAGGAIQNGALAPGELVFAEPSAPQRQVLNERFPGAMFVEDSAELFPCCRRVVLALKPQVLKSIAGQLAKQISSDHLIVSIAAGISLQRLTELLGTANIIRVMPNTPAMVGAGASAFAADASVVAADVLWTEQLLSSVGMCVAVPDALMHAVTGVSGSSPAYCYLMIEALSDGGVAMGLPRATATKLAAQAMLGAAKMVLDTGLHPGELKDQVTSPGGTTIAALRTLEAAGVRSALIEAVARCAERSSELGK